jgi:hypothetical protein
MKHGWLLCVLCVVSWVVMTVTHELGHVVGGWLGGAELKALDLAPWRLPYSVHAPDPHPQLTLWSGPVIGVLVPLAAAVVVRHQYVRFVADFCLLANGLYLALAWFSGDRFLDTPRMLAAGVHPAWIALFCIVTISVGYLRARADCMAVLQGARQ